MNPTLFDLIKLYVTENFPDLFVDYWPSENFLPADQIRISTAPLELGSMDVPVHSLIAITESIVFYRNGSQGFWGSFMMVIESPLFFDKLDIAIEIAISARIAKLAEKEEEIKK